HDVHPKGGAFTQLLEWQIQVRRGPPRSVRASIEGTREPSLQTGHLGCLIDHASRGTTAESRRRRSLHDIHLFQVERIPVIAAKIAHSIDVKIVTGAETANRQVVALRAAFARRDTDARD